MADLLDASALQWAGAATGQGDGVGCRLGSKYTLIVAAIVNKVEIIIKNGGRLEVFVLMFVSLLDDISGLLYP